MNGDLSLSQALGGLRIANPDSSEHLNSSSSARPSSASFARPEEISVSDVDPPGSPSRAVADTLGGPIVRPLRLSICSNLSRNRVDVVSGSPALAYTTLESSQQDGSDASQTDRHLSPPIRNAGLLSPQAQGISKIIGGADQADAVNSTSNEDLPFTGNTSTPATGDEWEDRGAAVGMRRHVDSNGRATIRQVKKGVRDFNFGRILGEGSYSTVYLATDRQTLKEYAVKVLEKRHIIKEKKIKYVNIEKNTLNRLTDHPGIVRLYYTFQDENSLYYVLDLCSGGELLGVLKKTGTFDIECAKFYGAQILDSVDYMHSRGVIHRDLKPENVLLDNQMHVKITDFGTAKLLNDPREMNISDGTEQGQLGQGSRQNYEDSRSASFVGTAEYVSPELLTQKIACKASDVWAFGCIIYQLLAGRPPFKAGSEYLTFQKIVNLDYEFPLTFPATARDLVERCLVLDPSRRLTIEHLKNHKFFHGQKFGKGLWRMKPPRLRPFILSTMESTIGRNGGPSDGGIVPTNSASTSSGPQSHVRADVPSGKARPPRIVTELPPPTQLDIEWSPVLTKNNERILKLGDWLVNITPLHNVLYGKTPEEGHKKLSRFFGGSITRKRHRLVMVTSGGRIVLAPAGGEEKRAKQEISLLSPGCSWRGQQDPRGQPIWCVDTDGYHYVFEEAKTHSSEGGNSSVEDWIECLEKARDMAVSTRATGQGDDDGLTDIPSTISSPASTLGSRVTRAESCAINDRASRNHLTKAQTGVDDSSVKRTRFSKRQSRNGLGSAF
ncbi:hypothetical protein CDD83_4719 [Cordyceps sp. RAO-2017]|nr:hypothetical protein CDD83_4719 [Cordyceps sp. RAO-2017]